MTSYVAISQPGAAQAATPFDAADAPVLQVVLSSGTLEDWQAGKNGLSPRDAAAWKRDRTTAAAVSS